MTDLSARRRSLKPPIHNPFDKFTQPEFDVWIGGITGALRKALGHVDEEEKREESSSYDFDREGTPSTGLWDDNQEEMNEESVDPLESNLEKGKARDPREGPGLGPGTVDEPIELDSDDDEEVGQGMAEEYEEYEEGDEEGEEEDYEDGPDARQYERGDIQKYHAVQREEAEDIEEEGEVDETQEHWKSPGDSYLRTMSHPRNTIVGFRKDKEYDEAEEAEGEYDEGDGYYEQDRLDLYEKDREGVYEVEYDEEYREERESAEDDPIIISEGEEENDENIPPVGHVEAKRGPPMVASTGNVEEEEEEEEEEEDIPHESILSDFEAPHDAEMEEGTWAEEEFDELNEEPVEGNVDGTKIIYDVDELDDEEQPPEGNTVFPLEAKELSPEKPVSIRDVWAGPQNFAEDYYAAGDIRGPAMNVHQLGEFDASSDIAAFLTPGIITPNLIGSDGLATPEAASSRTPLRELTDEIHPFESEDVIVGEKETKKLAEDQQPAVEFGSQFKEFVAEGEDRAEVNRLEMSYHEPEEPSRSVAPQESDSIEGHIPNDTFTEVIQSVGVDGTLDVEEFAKDKEKGIDVINVDEIDDTKNDIAQDEGGVPAYHPAEGTPTVVNLPLSEALANSSVTSLNVDDNAEHISTLPNSQVEKEEENAEAAWKDDANESDKLSIPLESQLEESVTPEAGVVEELAANPTDIPSQNDDDNDTVTATEVIQENTLEERSFESPLDTRMDPSPVVHMDIHKKDIITQPAEGNVQDEAAVTTLSAGTGEVEVDSRAEVMDQDDSKEDDAPVEVQIRPALVNTEASPPSLPAVKLFSDVIPGKKERVVAMDDNTPVDSSVQSVVSIPEDQELQTEASKEFEPDGRTVEPLDQVVSPTMAQTQTVDMEFGVSNSQKTIVQESKITKGSPIIAVDSEARDEQDDEFEGDLLYPDVDGSPIDANLNSESPAVVEATIDSETSHISPALKQEETTANTIDPSTVDTRSLEHPTVHSDLLSREQINPATVPTLAGPSSTVISHPRTNFLSADPYPASLSTPTFRINEVAKESHSVPTVSSAPDNVPHRSHSSPSKKGEHGGEDSDAEGDLDPDYVKVDSMVTPVASTRSSSVPNDDMIGMNEASSAPEISGDVSTDKDTPGQRGTESTIRPDDTDTTPSLTDAAVVPESSRLVESDTVVEVPTEAEGGEREESAKVSIDPITEIDPFKLMGNNSTVAPGAVEINEEGQNESTTPSQDLIVAPTVPILTENGDDATMQQSTDFPTSASSGPSAFSEPDAPKRGSKRKRRSSNQMGLLQSRPEGSQSKKDSSTRAKKSSTDTGKGKGKKKQRQHSETPSMSSSGASTAAKMLQPSSRASSVGSSATMGDGSAFIHPSSTVLSKDTLQIPMYQQLMLHSHSRPRPPPYNPIRPSLSLQTQIQVRGPSTAKSSDSPHSPDVGPSSSPSQPKHASRSASMTNPATTTRSTRSNCRYHKISLPEEEGGPDIFFLVPGCSLVDKDLIEEEEIQDHGDATYEDSLRKVDDIETLDIHAYVLGVIRQLVGPDKEQDVYYLPKLGEERARKVRHKKKMSRISSRDFGTLGESHGSNGALLSPSSRPPVSVAGSSSTNASRRKRRHDVDNVTVSSYSSDEDDDSGRDEGVHTKSPKRPKISHVENGEHHEGNSTKRVLKRRLGNDAAEYQPGNTDDVSEVSSEEEVPRRRKHGKKGLKRTRTDHQDERKSKKPRIPPIDSYVESQSQYQSESQSQPELGSSDHQLSQPHSTIST